MQRILHIYIYIHILHIHVYIYIYIYIYAYIFANLLYVSYRNNRGNYDATTFINDIDNIFVINYILINNEEERLRRRGKTARSIDTETSQQGIGRLRACRNKSARNY